VVTLENKRTHHSLLGCATCLHSIYSLQLCTWTERKLSPDLADHQSCTEGWRRVVVRTAAGSSKMSFPRSPNSIRRSQTNCRLYSHDASTPMVVVNPRLCADARYGTRELTPALVRSTRVLVWRQSRSEHPKLWFRPRMILEISPTRSLIPDRLLECELKPPRLHPAAPDLMTSFETLQILLHRLKPQRFLERWCRLCYPASLICLWASRFDQFDFPEPHASFALLGWLEQSWPHLKPAH